jgi:16S rRNA C967 or C1407 C5-methylase (RsmB/RsmF family)
MKRRREGMDGNNDRNPLSSARRGKASSSFSSSSGGCSSGKKKDGDQNNVEGGRKNNNNKNDDGRRIINRADRDARNLWHRKSGVGYRLFLSYYGMQPPGVAFVDCPDDDIDDSDTRKKTKNDDDAASDEDDDDDGGISSGGGVASRSSGGKGMSRASRRRRSRRRKEKVPPTTTMTAGRLGAPPPRDVSSVVGGNVANANATVRPRARDNRTAIDESRHSLRAAYATSKCRYRARLCRFVNALSRPLPLTFRFRVCAVVGSDAPSSYACSSAAADDVKRRLREEYIDLVAPAHYDSSTVSSSTNGIYQSTSHSSLCRHNLGTSSPKLRELIVMGSNGGLLARQELGSMLPVIGLRGVGALDVGSKVLDLCASPGSKTLQALEVVGSTGRVIANDVHPGRLDALREAVHRSGMSSRLASRVTYTNYDASAFPCPRSGRLFDAVLCDVPCGGDGTIRKDAHVLPMWSPNISNSMHVLQLRILLRALQLVKVGGVVCYSTCSMNPIEDEAVVAAALRGRTESTCGSDGGGVSGCAMYELLDWPNNSLPGLVLRPGVSDWKVAFYDHDGGAKKNDDEYVDDGDDDEDNLDGLSFFDSYVSASAAGVDGDVSPTFWPNTAENGNLGLHRCVRLLPQDQDSGGFFLGLIRRCS